LYLINRLFVESCGSKCPSKPPKGPSDQGEKQIVIEKKLGMMRGCQNDGGYWTNIDIPDFVLARP
jgi:hypothetical protein